jgi:hypothetical protein
MEVKASPDESRNEEGHGGIGIHFYSYPCRDQQAREGKITRP